MTLNIFLPRSRGTKIIQYSNRRVCVGSLCEWYLTYKAVSFHYSVSFEGHIQQPHLSVHQRGRWVGKFVHPGGPEKKITCSLHLFFMISISAEKRRIEIRTNRIPNVFGILSTCGPILEQQLKRRPSICGMQLRVEEEFAAARLLRPHQKFS